MNARAWGHLLRLGPRGIGTRLTLAFGLLVGLTTLVVMIAWLAGRNAARDIEFSEAVRAPASLASAQAQEALLRMQLHLRGYLMLSDAEDTRQYDDARADFERALGSLQALAAGWGDAERRQVQALTEGYGRWKRLPPMLFALHEDTLRNRPALRLARVDVQARRVRVLAECETMIELQKQLPEDAQSRETLAAMLAFQSSFDALATNVMAFGASGESQFRYTYAPQLVTNAAQWNALNARRAWLTPAQRARLDRIAEVRAELTTLALQIRQLLDGERAVEDLYLYRTEAAPQARSLLVLLQQITAHQQAQLQTDLARARASLARAHAQTLAGGVLAVLLGAAMAYLLRRHIVGPVQRLTEVAGRIAGGELGARANAEAEDEIGRLAESFNTMAERVASTIANLEAAYAEARSAGDEAEAASLAKSRFLASMSHELRTPLNAVLGYAQLLQMDSTLTERQAKGVTTIRNSGDHLLTLINDLLDLARIEAGKAELAIGDVDLAALLGTVVDIVRVEAQRKGLAFEQHSSGRLPAWVRADEKRLRQVLLNLLNNAVKFTAGGRVSLRVTAQDTTPASTRVRFEVEDTGIGIAPEQQARLFRPFEQATQVQKQYGGSGLGLSISRQLVRMMGSDIEVVSRPGAGSRFWFDIDLPPGEQPALPAAAAAPGPARATGYSGARRTVLVVDDVEMGRAPIVHFLHDLGFDTMEARDGAEALRRVREQRPDLVLMDSVMPVLGGREAIGRLRNDDAFRTLPIIVVSANATEADRQASLGAGADAFLAKPVDFEQLRRHIGGLLGLTWQ